MNPIGLSAPWAKSIDIITLQLKKNIYIYIGMIPIFLSLSLDGSLEMIAFRTVKYGEVLTQWALVNVWQNTI